MAEKLRVQVSLLVVWIQLVFVTGQGRCLAAWSLFVLPVDVDWAIVSIGRDCDRRNALAKLDAADRKKIPAKKYAFPKERKEPLENAAHVRNAIARFNQVEGVSEAEKDAAWKRIKAAAKKFDVEMDESSRGELKSSKKK
jgi:hypothetical protein